MLASEAATRLKKCVIAHWVRGPAHENVRAENNDTEALTHGNMSW